MILEVGKTYTVPNVTLTVRILAIYHRSTKGYTKAKIELTNGAYYETKTYKLNHKQIQHWKEA